jgi:ubiquinol-cytochrome c reductase cytochrome c subunit
VKRVLRWGPVAAVVVAAITVTIAAAHRPVGSDAGEVATGRGLYLEGCVSCHGVGGRGVSGRSSSSGARGPSLRHAGEAAAYYMLSTGRMPLNDPDQAPHRKDPAYTPSQIRALVAYVGSISDGPALPKVTTAGANLADGGETFRANCQACHSASGSGGALSYGRAAPNLRHATAEQIGAAVRSGPGQMPVFGKDQLSPEELDDLAAYVEYLRNPDDRGGLAIGRVGPVPEGFVAWSIGVVALLASVFWIGTRSPARRRARTATTAPTTAPTAAPEEPQIVEEAP